MGKQAAARLFLAVFLLVAFFMPTSRIPNATRNGIQGALRQERECIPPCYLDSRFTI
jgi:hypothetical protein